LLESPVLDLALARKAVLAVLRAQGFGKTVHDFVGVVASNRRLRDLRSIVAAFAALVAARRGVVTAHVTSAHPLEDSQVNHLRAGLIKAGFGNVAIERAVDPSLLGGLIVKIGARLYDSSLKSRLQRLQHAMRRAA
ncbi:MAG: ATP synthase F1 subunit delta, partial [Acetobacteraceae bacterium]